MPSWHLKKKERKAKEKQATGQKGCCSMPSSAWINTQHNLLKGKLCFKLRVSSLKAADEKQQEVENILGGKGLKHEMLSSPQCLQSCHSRRGHTFRSLRRRMPTAFRPEQCPWSQAHYLPRGRCGLPKWPVEPISRLNSAQKPQEVLPREKKKSNWLQKHRVCPGDLRVPFSYMVPWPLDGRGLQSRDKV